MSSGARSLNPAEMLHCIGEPPSWLPAATLKGSSRSCRAFRDPTFFTRWLFRQQRGAGVPQTPLLVGWREAKPCVQAIVAARTGNTGGLRDDHGRPELRAARPGIVNVAVKDMIVVVEQTRTRKAHEWAQDGAYGIDIHVVSSIVELHQWTDLESNKEMMLGAPARAAFPQRANLATENRAMLDLESNKEMTLGAPARAAFPQRAGLATENRAMLDLEWNKKTMLGEPARATFSQWAGLATENRAMLAFSKGSAGDMSVAYVLQV